MGSADCTARLGFCPVNAHVLGKAASTEDGAAGGVHGCIGRRVGAKVDTVQHGIGVTISLVGDAAAADAGFDLVPV